MISKQGQGGQEKGGRIKINKIAHFDEQQGYLGFTVGLTLIINN